MGHRRSSKKNEELIRVFIIIGVLLFGWRPLSRVRSGMAIHLWGWFMKGAESPRTNRRPETSTLANTCPSLIIPLCGSFDLATMFPLLFLSSFCYCFCRLPHSRMRSRWGEALSSICIMLIQSRGDLFMARLGMVT